ncbi:hypothetical protein AB0L53_05670 [Nonomuraea sp. NPDC052129]|uniref:hypothetical protein n=1 Tax=Nonomuraea sp. NPDC052129 TaxID=3154651 RepID=UPI00342B54C7
MDELTTLIKELEHEPPPSLARQRLRLLESATPRKRRWTSSVLSGRAQRGHARMPGLSALGGRRLALGGVLAGAAIAASVIVPVAIGSEVPAYALTKNPDGSITLQINEFRDPERVESDLADLGVTADITYLPLGKGCGGDRAPFLAGEGEPSTGKEDLRERIERSASYRAIRPRRGITIYPRYIKPGQIAMIEVAQTPVQPTSARGVVWTFTGRLTTGPIEPCKIVDFPTPPGN